LQLLIHKTATNFMERKQIDFKKITGVLSKEEMKQVKGGLLLEGGCKGGCDVTASPTQRKCAKGCSCPSEEDAQCTAA
jgi:hypothetical protein